MENKSLKGELCNIKMSSVLYYIAIFMFKVLLDFAYVQIIFPKYEYMGFVLVNDGMKVFSGFILFFLVMLFIPTTLDKPSNILSICLVIIIYIPTTTVFSYGDATYGFIFINTIFWIILLSIIKFVPTVEFKSLSNKVGKRMFLGVVFLMCFYCCFFVIKSFGININFNLLDVYDQRELYKAAQIPFSAYLFTWASNVVLPMGFMYLFINKKYVLCVLPIISQLLLFSATGMKSMLFTLPIVILFALFIKMNNANIYLMYALVIVSVGCIVAYTVYDQIMPVSLLLRRVFIVPARISQYYYDFFSEAGPINLSHSIFSELGEYRFETEPAKFISKIFVGTTSNFNSGIISDGFANFGYIGVVCWSIITAFVFKMLDCVSNGKNVHIVIAGIIMFISSLSNSALVTNLGTHGVMLAIFMIYILPKQESLKEAKVQDEENLYHDKCS